MTDIKTLLNIVSSNSFDELKSKGMIELDGMQRSFAADDEYRKTGCSGIGCQNREPFYGIHLCVK